MIGAQQFTRYPGPDPGSLTQEPPKKELQKFNITSFKKEEQNPSFIRIPFVVI